MAHNKNPNKSFNNAKGYCSHTSNHTSNNGHASHAHHETSKKKKRMILVRIVVKLTILKRISLKRNV